MVKLLVCGDVGGQLAILEARVRTVNQSHGPFDVVFAVGDFFGRNASALAPYTEGRATFPIPLYFVTGGDAALDRLPVSLPPGGGLVAPNIHFLGMGGIQTVAGLRVAFLSGIQGDRPTATNADTASVESASDASSAASTDDRPAESASLSWRVRTEDIEAVLGTADALDTGGPEARASLVDVLLTPQWPRGFHHRLLSGSLPQFPSDSAAATDTDPVRTMVAASRVGSAASARLARRLRPRYHFAGHMGVFFSRLPFLNTTDPLALTVSQANPVGVTRFVALGRVVDPATAPTPTPPDRKWMHALTLEPLESATLQVPAGTTLSPLLPTPSTVFAPPPMAAAIAADVARSRAGSTRQLDRDGGGRSAMADMMAEVEAESRQIERDRLGGNGPGFFFFWQRGPQRKRPRDDESIDPRSGAAAARPGPGDPGFRGALITAQRKDCWFCPSSTEFQKHMLVSIAEEVYVTVPRGPIDATHVLIVPISHVACVGTAPAAIRDEVHKYKLALRAWLATRDCGLVLFERAVRTMGASHAHLQAVGVPRARIAGVIDAIQSLGREHGLAFAVLDATTSLETVAGADQFLYMELPATAGDESAASEPGLRGLGASGEYQPLRLFHKVPAGASHPLQFGREAVCAAMHLPERRHWKDCEQTREEEESAAAAARESFQPFDFALGDDDA